MIKRNDIFLYAASITICVVSYIAVSRNIELSLLPHKTVLEYLFNFNFVFIDAIGYKQSNELFIITKDCLGINLFISLFLIMVFGFLQKYKGIKRKITVVIKFYFTAFALAFIITVIRISASVPFCAWEKFYLMHNMLSLGIYFSSGLFLYFVMEKRIKAL